MTDVQSQVTSNASSVAQWAAVEALLGPQDEVRVMAAEFDRRRHVIVDGLNRLPGVSCIKPKGAFYAFANVAGLFGPSSASAAGAGPVRRLAHAAARLVSSARLVDVARGRF